MRRVVYPSQLKSSSPLASSLFPYTTLFRSAPAHVERSDVCIIPAAGVVAEAMLALVLADALCAKFGEDTMDDLTAAVARSEEHTSELQSRGQLVCRLLLEKKKDIDGSPVKK